MAIDPEKISRALSNLALIQDSLPTHTHHDLNKAQVFEALVDDGRNTEALYMLAAYCFDVSKRFAMLQRAVADICTVGTPDVDMAALIRNHDEALNNDSITTWHQRAIIAGAQLSQWHDLVQEPNTTYVATAAAMAGGGEQQS
jgi:hypothetical protein